MPIVRLMLGCTYILSGFVKAVDPKGFSYKIEEYLHAAHISYAEWLNLPLVAAVALSCAEFVLGMYLLLGLRRKFTAVVTLLVTMVFTIISVLLVVYRPVSDCGCFGEWISFTETQTLAKNVVLLALSILLARHPQVAKPLVPEGWQWLVSLYTCVFIFLFSLRAVYYLPLIDFRQYKIGADLREMVFPTHEDIKPEEISDFMVLDTLGEDQTAELLFSQKPQMLIIAPLLREAAASATEQLAEIGDWCSNNDYEIYCLTASPMEEVRQWCYYNDADFHFLQADHTLLKTMIRSNPGLMLLRDGVIRNKWSCNHLPHVSGIPAVTEPQLEASAGSNGRVLLRILAWYLLPLLLIIFISNLIKRRKKKEMQKHWVQTDTPIAENDIENDTNIINLKNKKQ